MTIEDVEIGDQVICVRLCPLNEVKVPSHFISNDFGREVGHIGYIASVFVETESVYVIHQEFTPENGYVEFATSFFLSELEPFNPPVTPDSQLRSAIQKNLVQITRE